MIFRPLQRDEAVIRFGHMAGVEKWDTSAGLCGIEQIIGGGDAFIVCQGDRDLMAIVVQQVQQANGRELVVRVAQQLADDGDLTEQVLPEIERVFGQGCDVVTIYTKRAGLVKKLEKSGYQESAKIMRKKLR
jgi:hypothetical protein